LISLWLDKIVLAKVNSLLSNRSTCQRRGVKKENKTNKEIVWLTDRQCFVVPHPSPRNKGCTIVPLRAKAIALGVLNAEGERLKLFLTKMDQSINRDTLHDRH
jgi:hypothetical protein